MSSIIYNPVFEPAYGEQIKVARHVMRITAENPSPFTFKGTNTYLIGYDNLAIIDPGPLSESHFNAITRAIGNRPLTHIFVSHTHKDHSPLAAKLKERYGAHIYAEGPHRAARELHMGERNLLKESSDLDFKPDIRLEDGEIIDGGEWQLEAIFTPGHTSNHCAFALPKNNVLFSADHVMAWSTSIVAPPDGSMSDYMASLDKLIDRGDQTILPGHGGEVINPPEFLRSLKEHRLFRERLISETLSNQGAMTIGQLVEKIYIGLSPELVGAASLSVFAHLEDLIARGEIISDDTPSLEAYFRAGK